METDRSKNAVKIFDEMSKGYESKYMNVDIYAKYLNSFCDLVKPVNASIFEVACGPGNVTKYLLSQNPKLKITATDMSANMVKLAKQNNPSIESFKYDMRNLGSLPKKYNGIISSFGLPYINKDETLSFLANAYKNLYDNGVLYLSSIQGNYDDSAYAFSTSAPDKKVFIHLYKKELIGEHLSSLGFDIVVADYFHYNHPDGKKEYQFIIIAIK